MNREDIYNAITQVDERYIDEATADIQKGRRRLGPWLRWGAIAACLALMLASPLSRQFYQSVQERLGFGASYSGDGAVGASADCENVDTAEGEAAEAAAPRDEADSDGAVTEDQVELFVPQGTIIRDPPERNAIYCYAAPKEGTWFCHAGAQAALEEHTGEEVYYFLAIDLFQREELVDPEGEAARKELSRLRGEGYLVGLSEVVTEESGETEVYAAGYFTAEQLEQFDASDEFGYGFYFRSEEYWDTGDGIYLAPMPE